jgi:hypothetical protein
MDINESEINRVEAETQRIYEEEKQNAKNGAFLVKLFTILFIISVIAAFLGAVPK